MVAGNGLQSLGSAGIIFQRLCRIEREKTYQNQQEKQQGVPRGGKLVLLETFEHLRTPNYKIAIQSYPIM